MAKVDTSGPFVVVTVVSEPPETADGALSADLLADFALTLAEHGIPGDTPVLCTHAPTGHLSGLWVQAQVPYQLPTETGSGDPACPVPSCAHPASRHLSHNARGKTTVGCQDCDCTRSKERVLKLVEASA